MRRYWPATIKLATQHPRAIDGFILPNRRSHILAAFVSLCLAACSHESAKHGDESGGKQLREEAIAELEKTGCTVRLESDGEVRSLDLAGRESETRCSFISGG